MNNIIKYETKTEFLDGSELPSRIITIYVLDGSELELYNILGGLGVTYNQIESCELTSNKSGKCVIILSDRNDLYKKVITYLDGIMYNKKLRILATGTSSQSNNLGKKLSDLVGGY